MTKTAVSLSRLSDFARRLGKMIRSGGGHLDDDDAFNRAALELFDLQFVANAAYRRWAVHRGVTPDAVTHWTAIPAIPAMAFKELELSALPPGARTRVFHSSGTTGQQPGRHYHGPESLALYEDSLGAWFAPHLVPHGRPVTLISLTPPPEAAPHSSLVHMLAAVVRQYGGAGSAFVGAVGSDGWMVGLEALKKVLLPALQGDQPVLLAGTAFNFVHLLDSLAATETHLCLPAGSRVMETGGYKGRSRELPRAELHAALIARLGVPAARIVSEYGMSELGSQAYDRVAGRDGPCGFRFPPWARARVIAPETGAEAAPGLPGRLRVLDLANVWSVAMIQTEDLAVAGAHGFELLGRVPVAEPRGCSLLAA